VGKQWTGLPQQETSIGEIYLPLIEEGTLTPVSATQVTPITFPPSVLAENPELAGVVLMVPPNSLFADNGQRGGRVGIAAVQPDRLPEPLPPGFNFPLVITVQTDGATNFDVPVPICFPNIDNPDTPENEQLEPGAKSALWSFDHDIGDWVIQGSMTVSPDGLLICTDPGVGINEPGWHGDNPGTQGSGGGGGPEGCNDICCPGDYDEDYLSAQYRAFRLARARCIADVASEAPGIYNSILDAIIGARSGDNPFSAFKDAYEGFNNAADKRDQCNEDLQDCFPGFGGSSPPSGVNDPTGLGGKVDKFSDTTDDLLDQIEDLKPQLDDIVDLMGGAEGLDEMSSPGREILEGLLDDLIDQMQSPLNSGNWKNGVEDFVTSTDDLASDTDLRLDEEFNYSIEDNNGIVLHKGKSRPTRMPSLILPSDELLTVKRHFPISGTYSSMQFMSGSNGTTTLIAGGITQIDDSIDTDDDGLTDNAEAIIGTSHLLSDTDDDGVSDGAEIAAGTDPLDGFPARTGIIGSVLTDGTAVDVAALDGLAAVADGEAGVTVFNVFNGMRPLRVAQVDTRGSARRVALARNRVLVADGIGGAALIDTTDPPASYILSEYGDDLLWGQGVAVTINGPYGFIGTSSGRVVVIDLDRGDLVTARSGLGNVRDINFERDTLYVLSNGLLTALSFDSTELDLLGFASAPGTDAVHSWR
jgi:hypothetical protein